MLGWNLFGNYILWNEGPEKSNKDQTTDQFSKNCAQNKYQVVQNWVHVGQGLKIEVQLNLLTKMDEIMEEKGNNFSQRRTINKGTCETDNKHILPRSCDDKMFYIIYHQV